MRFSAGRIDITERERERGGRAVFFVAREGVEWTRYGIGLLILVRLRTRGSSFDSRARRRRHERGVQFRD